MLSDEVETAQTVSLMDELSEQDAAHRLVIDATARALDEDGLTFDASPLEKTVAIYWFLKRSIRYVPTEGTSPLVDQTLIPPATLLAMPDPEGDCPQFSMLASAMLRVCCIPSFYKTIAAAEEYPNTYSHIYNMVDVGGGSFMPFDSSNGPAPGAEFAHPYKARVWPQIRKITCDGTAPSRDRGVTSDRAPATMGRPVTRDAAGSFQPRQVTKGNRAMQRMRNAPVGNRNAILRRGLQHGHLFYPLQGLRRLGQDDGSDIADTFSSGPGSATPDYYTPATTSGPTCGVDIACGSNPTAAELANAGFPLATAIATAPSPVTGNSSPSPTTLAAALAADATQLVSPIIKAATQQQPYYITNPQTGQSVLYNPNTGGTAGTFGASLSSLSPTTILIGVVLIGALAMFSGKK